MTDHKREVLEQLRAAIDRYEDVAMAKALWVILEMHAPYADDESGDVICQTCLEGSHLYEEKAYPCPTLVALAAGYGIEVD